MSNERLYKRILQFEKRLGEVDYMLNLKMDIDNLENGRREAFEIYRKEIDTKFSEIREKANLMKVILKAIKVEVRPTLIDMDCSIIINTKGMRKNE